MNTQTLVVVGAGPIGLEAALRANHDGYNVTVLEQGEVGAAIRRWGHVKLFTPFGMNSTAAGRRAAGAAIETDEILSGFQLANRYLETLANCSELKGRVLPNHRVVAVSRTQYGKSDRIGKPNRADMPFRILVNAPGGQKIVEADALLDCTGFISVHRHLGAGGIPCPGEDLLTESSYQLPNVGGTERNRFANRHTLVVGSGYSAATSICALANLAKTETGTKVTWVTRGNRDQPVAGIPDDPLTERVSLAESANQLAASEDSCVDWVVGPLVDSISRDGQQFTVSLSYSDGEVTRGRAEQVVVDEIIANVGYRPDTRPFEELQIHRCYATEGPIKLAAHLLGETSGDCLQQSSAGPALLRNPEPNFYILGAASYGRDTRFLLQTGLKQVEELFDSLKAEQVGVPV